MVKQVVATAAAASAGVKQETPKPLPELLPYAAMLSKLTARRDARPFAAPMRELWDPAVLSDYLAKIKQPMDLRTIGERLARGEYNGAGHAALAADVRLIWSNCKTYTPNPENIYHQQANRMSEWFEADYAALCNTGDRAQGNTGGEDSAGMQCGSAGMQ